MLPPKEPVQAFDRTATSSEYITMAKWMISILLLDIISHIVIYRLGYSKTNNYAGTVIDDICSSKAFNSSLMISITVTVIGMMYIVAHFMNVPKLNMETTIVTQSLLFVVVAYTTIISYLISVCSDLDSANVVTYGVGVNFHFMYDISFQSEISVALVAFRGLRPRYFEFWSLVIVAIFSALNQMVDFVNESYLDSIFLNTVSAVFNALLVGLLGRAIYFIYTSYSRDGSFSLARFVLIIAIANVLVCGLNIWMLTFTLDSMTWEETGSTTASGFVFTFLSTIVVLFFTCNYMIFHERLNLAKGQQARIDLLNRILPPNVTDKLLQKEIPEAESFDSVTILFSDIKGFTDISGKCPPGLVMNMLNDLYVIMDYCCKLLDLYKVETIGDAYMIASGITDGRDGADGAVAIANFAILVSYCCQFVLSPVDGSPIQLRLGAHSGPVTAGVVGNLMPRYCLFGDTVNVASRMESNSEAMMIHISQTTATLLQSRGLHELESRGFISIKGKGLMNTFWLTKNMLRENTYLSPQLLESTCQTIEAMRRKTDNFSMFEAMSTLQVLLVECSSVMRKVNGKTLAILSRELGQRWVITIVSSPEEAIKLIDDHAQSIESDTSSSCRPYLFDLIFTTQHFHTSMSSMTGSDFIASLLRRKQISSSDTIAIGITMDSCSTMEMLSSGMKWVWEKPLPPPKELLVRIRSDSSKIPVDFAREQKMGAMGGIFVTDVLATISSFVGDLDSAVKAVVSGLMTPSMTPRSSVSSKRTGKTSISIDRGAEKSTSSTLRGGGERENSTSISFRADGKRTHACSDVLDDSEDEDVMDAPCIKASPTAMTSSHQIYMCPDDKEVEVQVGRDLLDRYL